MTFHGRKDMLADGAVQPRAIGSLDLAVKARGASSAIARLRSEGCLKALFPRRGADVGGADVDCIAINTAGGLTGGDRLHLNAAAEEGARLGLTTQAAERAYRAASGMARMSSTLAVAAGGRIDWLPQEMILFEGARLERSLRADLAGDGRLLLVEPVVFGRVAMGERLRDVAFRDRIEIWRDGAPLYCDALRIEGNLEAQMARAALGRGAGAMAALVFVGPEAEAHLSVVRAHLPATGGASLLRPDVMVARVLAEDGFALRQTLVPVLDRLRPDGLPTSWRL